jgi:hypothetical protein
MRYLIWISALGLACGANPSNPEVDDAPKNGAPDATDAQADDTTEPIPDPGERGMKDLDRLVRDVPQEELHARYGPPHETSSFMATEGPGEMQVEILNDYPPSDPASSQTKIIENTWRGEDYTFVAWLHLKNDEWVGLQAIAFSDDVEF